MKRLIVFLLCLSLLLTGTAPAFAADGPQSDYPYTTVYEPETSWAMSATVAWLADETALHAAQEEVRPSTALVWLDEQLRVYDRSGRLLSESLDEYVNSTVASVIPAFYLRNTAEASALKAWLKTGRLKDCFVVSTPDRADLVKSVADLLHVRGMLDCSQVTSPNRQELIAMAASANGAHGKVILLAYEAASRENIRLLQSIGSTVWVRTPSDLRSLLTVYTRGVNGVVVTDFHAAIQALELFHDDAPSLLRLPFITGHRGDPSTYVENTVDSALGAYAEGVDAVELDLHMSLDNQLFVFHDGFPRRFLCLNESGDAGQPLGVEAYNLSALQQIPFSWDDPEYGIRFCNRVPAAQSRYGFLYGQQEQKVYTLPAFSDYLNAFTDGSPVWNVEIKSYNPAILPLLRNLADRSGLWDRMNCITFNRDILDAVYRSYPQISIGVLGTATDAQTPSYLARLDDYQGITDRDGKEAALCALYRDIDRWNACYCPEFSDYGAQMVRAGRHRGLSVWTWAYGTEDLSAFARDYLDALTGLTLDTPWVTSELVANLSSAHIACASEDDIPKPYGTTMNGTQTQLADAELIRVIQLSDTQTLMMWRYRASLILNGTDYGHYYLYSEPFVFRLGAPSGFHDVAEDAYYAGPVEWAVKQGITDGTSETTFSPDQSCTRAQAVTFLWRAAGCPEPKTEESPFSDVAADAYYSKAVLWAAETGVTTGTSDTAFSPEAFCSRAQIVTFLWRAAGEPAAQHPSAFQDVPSGVYYHEPVDWAAGSGITDGTGPDTFSPNSICTRAQVVTFLYRARGPEAD